MAVPPGVIARFNTSPLYPPKTPDLIGLEQRAFFDATGLVQHRSIGDLMRYVALVEGMESADRFGTAGPFAAVPPSRFSDEQLYAGGALCEFAATAPESQRSQRSLTAGRDCLRATRLQPLPHSTALHQQCVDSRGRLHRSCGTRIQIQNYPGEREDRLQAGDAVAQRYWLLPCAVTRGVWYRGPFEHNGSVATLEDWFDPARLRDDYVPTGSRVSVSSVAPSRAMISVCSCRARTRRP